VLATDAAPQPGVDMFSVSTPCWPRGHLQHDPPGDCDPIATRPQSAWTCRPAPRFGLRAPSTSGSTFVAVPPATGSGPAVLNRRAGAVRERRRGFPLVRKQGSNTAPTPVIEKPGDNDPPQPPVDPGQTPRMTTATPRRRDEHRRTLRRFAGDRSQRRSAGLVRQQLPASEAGRISTVRVWEETSFNFLTLGFYDSDGTTFLGTTSPRTTRPGGHPDHRDRNRFCDAVPEGVAHRRDPGHSHKVSVLDDTLTAHRRRHALSPSRG
jgi:hypothetical protein